VRLTSSPPSCAEYNEIWEPKRPETLWATPGLLRDSFTYTLPAGYKCYTHQYGHQIDVSESTSSSTTTQDYQYDRELYSVLTIYLVLGQYNQELPYH